MRVSLAEHDRLVIDGSARATERFPPPICLGRSLQILGIESSPVNFVLARKSIRRVSLLEWG